MPLLLIVFGPAIAALLLAVLPRNSLSRWVIAVPAVAFVYLAAQTTVTAPARLTLPWVPSLGVALSFQLDGLGLLFALVVTGVGALVLLYASAYFSKTADFVRFSVYTLLFMSAMLGIVLSSNLLLIFVFWEITSVASYLLIGFNHEDEEAREGARRALLVTGTAQPGLDAKLAAAVAAPVKAATNARLADKIVTMADLPKLGAPATVVSRRPIGLAGMESITFSNGVKLTLFANDAETEKVRINVRFGHGQQAFSPVKPVASWAGDYALVASGIGTLGQRELDDLTNGRRMGMDFSIDEDAFELQAVTRPADYKDQLRLFATKLGAPGWDPAPIARVKAGATVAYDAMTRSPDAVLGRDLGWLLHDKDVRFRTPSLAEINALTPQAFRATWEPILASGPIEVQIFGQVKPDDAIAAVAQTLGALPPRADTPVPAANLAMRFPAHVETPIVLRHKGDKEQAAAVMAWPTSGGFTLQKEARQLEILTQIFNDRLFDRLRSTEGAAYSPSVQNSWPFSYESGGYILVTSQVRPDRIAYFYDVVKSTAADLARTPVSEDELQRAVAPMRQMLMRAGTGNAFWMNQMEGATHDARYVAAMQTMAQDMLTVTPAQLQALAARYLVPAKSWSAIVLPEGVEAK